MPQYNSIPPDWVLAQKGIALRVLRIAPDQKGGLTALQELSRQKVGLASPDNSDTHDSNGGSGRRCRSGWRGRSGRRCGRRGRSGRRGRRGGGATSYASAASVEDREPAELQAT